MPKFTKSGKPTALGDVEGKLKKEYGDNKGAVFGTLNKIGLMRGNKETPKGAQMQAKHDRDVKAGTASGMHPKMQQRAQMVKEAHSHLSQAIPGFNGLPKQQRMMAVQHHVNLRQGKAR